MTTNDIAGSLQRTLRRQTIATGLLYLIVVAAIGWVWMDTQRTEDSLCDLRHDLELRVETSRQFLRDNPNGIPGLSGSAIQTSIDNQQRTVEALADLDCD